MFYVFVTISFSLPSIAMVAQQVCFIIFKSRMLFDSIYGVCFRVGSNFDTQWHSNYHNLFIPFQLLSYVETTSTECILYPDISLTSPAPSVNEPIHIVEQKLQSLVEQQCGLEADYVTESSHFSW